MANDKPKGKFTTVSIPVPLFNKVQKRIDGTGFTSVSSYVAYLLRVLIASEGDSDEQFSEKDAEKVKERLRALGYLE